MTKILNPYIVPRMFYNTGSKGHHMLKTRNALKGYLPSYLHQKTRCTKIDGERYGKGSISK